MPKLVLSLDDLEENADWLRDKRLLAELKKRDRKEATDSHKEVKY